MMFIQCLLCFPGMIRLESHQMFAFNHQSLSAYQPCMQNVLFQSRTCACVVLLLKNYDNSDGTSQKEPIDRRLIDSPTIAGPLKDPAVPNDQPHICSDCSPHGLLFPHAVWFNLAIAPRRCSALKPEQMSRTDWERERESVERTANYVYIYIYVLPSPDIKTTDRESLFCIVFGLKGYASLRPLSDSVL